MPRPHTLTRHDERAKSAGRRRARTDRARGRLARPDQHVAGAGGTCGGAAHRGGRLRRGLVRRDADEPRGALARRDPAGRHRAHRGATGIANIWARDASAAANGANTLNEAYDQRFVLGLGVSHAPAVKARGHEYDKPLSAMRDYVQAIAEHPYDAPPPRRPSPVVLAALGPRMLELARDRAAGAHPYFVPPAHIARAREILGPEPVLAPEQVVVLEADAERAREIGRRHMAYYLQLPNYVNNLRALRFTAADVADGGSDRLVDAIVAWGDEPAIGARLSEHFDAGADHVAVQAYAGDGAEALRWLERLAPALLR
jgi:probable F420-dependent oxidoreductase